MIVDTKKTASRDIVDFEIEFVDGVPVAGDKFNTFDTHHGVEWTVLKVGEGKPMIITCETHLGIGWDGQFAPSMVDTEAKRRPESFYYIHDEK